MHLILRILIPLINALRLQETQLCIWLESARDINKFKKKLFKKNQKKLFIPN